MDKLHIKFEDVKAKIDNYEFDKKFDAIVCITRGGLVPAGLLSYKLDCKNVFNIKAESYDDEKRRGEIYVQSMAKEDIEDLLDSKNILIVDDVYDSGCTMKAIIDELLNYKIEEDSLNTFCVITKQEDAVDYSLFECELGTWVVFPWDFE